MKKDLPPTPKTESAMSEEKIEVQNNISSRRKFITTSAVAGRVKEIQKKILQRGYKRKLFTKRIRKENLTKGIQQNYKRKIQRITKGIQKKAICKRITKENIYKRIPKENFTTESKWIFCTRGLQKGHMGWT